MEDLWPKDIKVTKLKTPSNILKEQASLLGEKTENTVEAEVIRYQGESWMKINDFAYSFNIVARTLDYKYQLFSITYGIKMYPLEISIDEDIKEEIMGNIPDKQDLLSLTIQVNSEKNFLEVLKCIFNSKKTKQVVQAILAQLS